MSKWKISITNPSLGGFAPAYYRETYPTYGNKNQSGAMVNCDCSNPGYITQGFGMGEYSVTGGTLTTMVKGITDLVQVSGAYGTGGNKVYNWSISSMLGDHTIDKGAVTGELGEDVVWYQGALYYSYNHSGSLGDIGKTADFSSFDDDWGSTVPTGAGTLVGTSGTSHQMIVGGNDVLYIANGRYVASYNGTTLVLQALDLPTDSVIQSIAWNSDRLYILANRPNQAGAYKNNVSVYIWDGTTDSWESEIKLSGQGGALRVKNGVVYIFYQDISFTGGYKLGYISGNSVKDLVNYSGGLPAFYQVTDYQDFIVWAAGGLIYAWGSGDNTLPVRLFQWADGGLTTVGGISSPFGVLVAASTESSSYSFRYAINYTVTSSWKSLMFDVTGFDRVAKIDGFRVNFEKLTSGASCAVSLVNNQGTTIYTDTISFTKLGAATTKYFPLNGKVIENFRVEFDFSSGSTTAPVKIKSCYVFGSSD